MKLLLDSHILLWWFAGSQKLGRAAERIITAPESQLVVSAASWWELGIKKALGRLDVDWAAARAILQKNEISILAVTFDHADAAADLPAHHGDPFDRMLVAQATVEGLKLLTRDKQLKAYGSVVHFL
ncbi:MAG TPA: type II toxin-antitoxin system VapC family toxin [Rhizomicrobium sp.]|nr:type II toxin-antitoxin system VapC family toxin [Rhizomicrobium sp.]